MIPHLFSSDRIKIWRSWIPFLVVLGPLGVIGLQIPNFALREGYIPLDWPTLMSQVYMLLQPALMMGITLLASIFAGIEHNANAWKQILALPVSRIQVYSSKYIWILVLLLISCLLTSVGMVGLSQYLGIVGEVPWAKVFLGTVCPMLAALPILSLQFWLSLVMQNQALPITIGVLGVVFGGGVLLPDWFPLNYPAIVMVAVRDGVNPIDTLSLGIGIGFVLMILGALHFAKRDVR